MKRFSFSQILIVTATAALASTGQGCDDHPSVGPADSEVTAEKTFSYSISASGYSSFRLAAVNGTIIISQVPGNDAVTVKATERVESKTYEDAVTHLDNLQVEVVDGAEEVFVRTLQPDRSDGRNYVVDYTITLPPNMNLALVGVNGTVDLNHITGNVDLILINGEIAADVAIPLGGSTDITVINGIVNMEMPQTTSANLEATVVNGTVTVVNLPLTNSVTSTRSVSGTVGEGRGNVTLKATNGNIQISGY